MIIPPGGMMDAAGRRFQYLFVDSPTLETCCGHVCLHNIPSQESKNEGLIDAVTRAHACTHSV